MDLKNDGTVWARGFNGNEVFGNSKIYDVEVVPVELPIKDIVAISGKMASVVFIKKDGSVWACGNNYRGSMGYGNTSYYSPDSLVLTPVKILGPDMADPTITTMPTPTQNQAGTHTPSTTPTAESSYTPSSQTSGFGLALAELTGLIIAACVIVYLWISRKK